MFPGTAELTSATFSGNAVFESATFTGNVRFENATFTGDSSYQQSLSVPVTVNVATKPLAATNLVLTASTTNPDVGQQVTFTATLKNGTKPISAKPVTIYHYANGVRYDDVTNKNTDANGQVTATASFGYAGQRTYYATFAGDSSYPAATSSVLTINAR